MAITNDKEFKATLAGLPVASSVRWPPASCSGCSTCPTTCASRPPWKWPDVRYQRRRTDRGLRRRQYRPGGKLHPVRQGNRLERPGRPLRRQGAVACVGAPEAGSNLAWDAAMQARMARTCQTVATGEGTENREAEEQYRILEAFLNQ
jgi:hypothetical protein